MCVACSNIPEIPVRSVPLKYILSAVKERKSIEKLGDEIVGVTWHYAGKSYMVSFEIEYSDHGHKSRDVINFAYEDR